MTEDSSPKNLRKFLESDDPAMVQMGLSMAKGSGVPEDLLGEILWMYMFHDDKTVRATAKLTFMKQASEDLKDFVKENWKASYRTLSITDDRFLKAIRLFLETFKPQDDFVLIALEPLITALENDEDSLPLTLTMGYQPRAYRYREGEHSQNCNFLYGNCTCGQIVAESSEIKELQSAAYALGKIGDKRAVKPLIKALEDGPYVRQGAAWALGKIGDTQAVEPLIKALGDGNASAVQALGEIGDTRAVEPLIKAFGENHSCGMDTKSKDEEVYVRRSFVKALRDIGDKRAVELLIKVLWDGGKVLRFEDEELRLEAIKSLREIGDKRAVEPLIKTLEDIRDKYDGYDGYYYVRRQSAIALGDIGDVRAVEPLIKAFREDKDENVRSDAASALGEIGDKQAVEPLIKALRDNQGRRGVHYIRESAAEALGKIGDKRAVKPLIKALNRELYYKYTVRKNVRSKAASALGEIGDKRAVEPLIKALKDNKNYVRENAAKALVKIARANIKGKEQDNIIKFLESDDSGMFRMGVSMLKGILEE